MGALVVLASEAEALEDFTEGVDHHVDVLLGDVAEVADAENLACKGSGASGQDYPVFLTADLEELSEVDALGGVDSGDGVGGNFFVGEKGKAERPGTVSGASGYGGMAFKYVGEAFLGHCFKASVKGVEGGNGRVSRVFGPSPDKTVIARSPSGTGAFSQTPKLPTPAG